MVEGTADGIASIRGRNDGRKRPIAPIAAKNARLFRQKPLRIHRAVHSYVAPIHN